jgi:ubiquinone/menaquinone biosynthesis C-methylase UbiE
MSGEREYVLGTHDEEIARLGLQHRVWRARVLDAWMHAGFTAGQTLLDAGCGPGYATVDLAEIAGPAGSVVAVDRSSRFLGSLAARASQHGLANIRAFEADLDDDALPDVAADGAWIRWVFAFVKRPHDVLRKVLARLKPGGTIVIHEYVDYRTWRFAPRSEIFERFVVEVMKSWRAEGGEPDIGMDLPHWLLEEGMQIRRMQTYMDVVAPSSFRWQWPKAFTHSGPARLAELGRISEDERQAIVADFEQREAAAHTLMVTPSVVEIIAQRPAS